jgi:hypothetical protein
MPQTYTIWQAVDAALKVSIRALEEARSITRQPPTQGPPGEPGKDGAPGKLPIVKAWESGVWYQGEVATKDGATYQASRDTANPPPSDEWTCIAQKGRGLRVRGTYDEAQRYLQSDIVARNGGSFVALEDDPGPCPGDGWQLWASQGKTGRPGERGPIGPPGKDGAGIIAGTFDAKEMKLILTRSDGGKIDVDMYDFALAVKDA